MDNKQAKKIYNDLNIDDKLIQADTHAKLINSIFGTNYKQMKASYFLPECKHEIFIWMVAMDGKEYNKWVNNDYDDIIVEEYLGEASNVEDDNRFNSRSPYRIAAKKIYINGKRYYKIKGIYKINLNISTPIKHIYERIND